MQKTLFKEKLKQNIQFQRKTTQLQHNIKKMFNGFRIIKQVLLYILRISGVSYKFYYIFLIAFKDHYNLTTIVQCYK